MSSGNMTTKNPFSYSFLTVILIMLALNAVIFNGMIISAADDLKVQYIPDDGFYYLSLARNYSTYGIWTFDSGVSTTSGFHLLFAYLLSSAFSLFHFDANDFVTFGVILSLLFAIFSIGVMWLWGFKHKNVLFLIFLMLIIGSRNYIYNSVSITEWSLTVLITSMYCVWFFTKYINPVIKRIDIFILFMLGLFGSIARTDSGILPFSIFISTLLPFLTSSKRSRLFATMGLLGALLGLLIVLTHNYLVTGEILQSSAMMKANWAQLFPPNYYSGSMLVTDIIGFPGLFFLAILIAGAIIPKFIKKTGYSSPNSHTINDSHILMIISAGGCILGYTLVYSRTVDIQPWYTVNLITPVLMGVFGISDYVTTSLHWKFRLIYPIFILLTIFFKVSNLYPINAFHAPWPDQIYMYQAGLYLNEKPLDARVGAWNAGIIGYYEGGHVINLDGLVNNDIYPYIVNHNMPAYLSSRGINYIMDFANMLTNKWYRLRGGYDDDEFLAKLKPLKVFEGVEYIWNHMTLYYIDEAEGVDK